jgi:hypothetical protein
MHFWLNCKEIFHSFYQLNITLVRQIPQIISVAKGKYNTAKVALHNNTNQVGKKRTL